MSRVALYVEGPASGLLRCARGARGVGDRVVTAALEDRGRRRGSPGPVLRQLVGRLQTGEIEAVVASLEADGPLVRLALQVAPAGRPGEAAAIYARSASSGAARSLDDQVERCRTYAERRGWRTTATYRDAACSGMTLERRPGWLELLAAAERGDFQVLVVDAHDRLGRDPGLVEGVLDRLRDMGVTVCTVEDGATPTPDLGAEEVRRVFDDYAAGLDVAAICEGLNAGGEAR